MIFTVDNSGKQKLKKNMWKSKEKLNNSYKQFKTLCYNYLYEF